MKHRTANNIFLRTATFTLTLALESGNLNLIKIFFILNICVKLQQNRSINEGARATTVFFKNSHCDLDLGPRPSNSKFIKILSYFTFVGS